MSILPLTIKGTCALLEFKQCCFGTSAQKGVEHRGASAQSSGSVLFSAAVRLVCHPVFASGLPNAERVATLGGCGCDLWVWLLV